MEKNTKSKNPKKNQKKKNNKRKPQPVNGFQNKCKNEQPKKECFENIPNKTVSSSPRPSNLPTINKTMEIKRNSGSEYEDFQTPSIEYDIKIDGFDGNKYGDVSPDYDKEWEEIGSFPSANPENIVEQDDTSKVNDVISNVRFPDVSVDVTEHWRSSLPLEICEDEGDRCINNYKSLEIETSDKKACDCTTNTSVILLEEDKNVERDFDSTKEKFAALFEESNEVEVDCEMTKENENVDNAMEVDMLIDETDDAINTESFVMCVNQFFEDIDGDGYGYPVEEESVKESEANIIESYYVSKEEGHSFEEMEKTKEEESNNGIVDVAIIIDSDVTDVVCTQDNLNDEMLSVQRFSLDFFHEPVIQKSMTLRSTRTENSFKQSATSITNVTSISDDNIVLAVDNDIKSSKKHKTNPFKLFIKKFKKAKTPEKESPKKKPMEHNLSLRSEDLIKDSEIESNQSLKSINDIDNNSQIFQETIGTEGKEELSIENNAALDPEPAHPSNDNGAVTTNCEKSNMFLNILKKKPRAKKEQDLKTPDDAAPKKIEEDIIQPELKIEDEVLIEFNDTVQSLICADHEVKLDERVLTNDCAQPMGGVMVVPDVDRCVEEEDEGDDHLFPDAITATKILGPRPRDVPYIDDQVVSQLDYITLYNGESKRLKISMDFFVPKASMETLYFPGDPIDSKDLKKSLISQSPCRRKRVLGSILGCMSRGR